MSTITLTSPIDPDQALPNNAMRWRVTQGCEGLGKAAVLALLWIAFLYETNGRAAVERSVIVGTGSPYANRNSPSSTFADAVRELESTGVVRVQRGAGRRQIIAGVELFPNARPSEPSRTARPRVVWQQQSIGAMFAADLSVPARLVFLYIIGRIDRRARERTASATFYQIARPAGLALHGVRETNPSSGKWLRELESAGLIARERNSALNPTNGRMQSTTYTVLPGNGPGTRRTPTGVDESTNPKG
ncbi:hypothetical protein [Rhodococcus sp. NPDC058514]|uniref:hypothetical protein n=1 Tax=unclassified Rhodococcus (in: high G+C Gram-positive bacteria) TaxID=192944 RepID=UPI00365C9FAA